MSIVKRFEINLVPVLPILSPILPVRFIKILAQEAGVKSAQGASGVIHIASTSFLNSIGFTAKSLDDARDCVEVP